MFESGCFTGFCQQNVDIIKKMYGKERIFMDPVYTEWDMQAEIVHKKSVKRGEGKPENHTWSICFCTTTNILGEGGSHSILKKF